MKAKEMISKYNLFTNLDRTASASPKFKYCLLRNINLLKPIAVPLLSTVKSVITEHAPKGNQQFTFFDLANYGVSVDFNEEEFAKLPAVSALLKLLSEDLKEPKWFKVSIDEFPNPIGASLQDLEVIIK